MAESVVVVEQPPQRFFCHLCNVEIENVSTEFTCPLCAGGFIEELPPAADHNASDDVEMTNDYDHRLTDQISSLLMSSIGGVRPMEEDGDHAQQDGTNSSGSSNNTNRWGNRRNRRRVTQDLPNFDNIMHEFLISITGGGTGAPMFFMGNPGDYAWGREGLDTVITQMLNQMENSGPPPLSREKIQDIPRVEIDVEQVSAKLQCSVCWDDFLIQESVRKLPCTHIYHDNCIVPWLELHGTCPVCRKVVDKEILEDQTSNTGINNMSNSIGQVYRALHNFRGDSESVNSSSSEGGGEQASTVSSQQQQQQQQSPLITSNRSSFQINNPSNSSQENPQSNNTNTLSARRDDDGNVEYDFD